MVAVASLTPGLGWTNHEWQSRWVGGGGGFGLGGLGKSASKRFEMAVRPMTNGMNSKISCHFANA